METPRKKELYEKPGLKVDNQKDVDRKRLEQRFMKKQQSKRMQRLVNNQDFIDYIYEVLELCGYFNSGDGPCNSQIYEKKGRLQIANKIADDLTFMSIDGIVKIHALRKEACQVNLKEEKE